MNDSRLRKACRLTKSAATILVVALGLCTQVVAAAATPPVVRATWHDTAGRVCGPNQRAAVQATVLVFSSATCPCADAYTDRVIDLAREVRGSGVSVQLVYSGPAETRDVVEAYIRRRAPGLSAVLDSDAELARTCGAVRTPTAVLLDSGGRIRYRGRFDDSAEPARVSRRYLEDALNAVLSRRPVALAETDVTGCAITVAATPIDRTETLPPRAARDDSAATSSGTKLIPGVGELRFPITTTSPGARRFFLQGLALWFGFNFAESERSFREAARLDPECAMAQSGITLALGMNYNSDFNREREPEAHAAIQKALQIAERTTSRERAYIAALATRHTGDAKADRRPLLERYHAEMAQVVAAYPEDVHAAVLYAASGMDLVPWNLWSKSGEPRSRTLEIVAVLEGALRRDPDHIGAHHFYIHATEASRHPERALASARKLALLAPRSGHLVHMPAHTWMRIGDYRRASLHNRRAADVDREYIQRENVRSSYVGLYYHNLSFLVAALSWEGRAEEAIATAKETAAGAGRHDPAQMAAMCATPPATLLEVWARFGRWDDILRARQPRDRDPHARGMWRYARGRALLARGDISGVERELEALSEARRGNQALTIATTTLRGKLSLAKGEAEVALEAFREGIAAEDALPYSEPPAWRMPVRESLGGALLTLNRPGEAEIVFRQDLERHRNSGRSLFGLWKALEAQGKRAEARAAEAEFRRAWARADTTLAVSDL